MIVKRRLNDEREISILARQFPKVKYLELLLPLDKFSFMICLKSILTRDDNIEKKCCFWSELINFSTELVYEQTGSYWNGNKFYDWFIRNTDLKYHKSHFYIDYSSSTLSIWF